MTAKVASRRHRTAVTINAGLSEYGFTKLDVTPDGGARAGRTGLMGLLLLMMPVCANSGTEVAVFVFHAQVKRRKEEENC